MVERHVFSRILVGTDGSERAGAAVAQAARLACGSDAPIDALFVIDTGRPHDRPVDPIAQAALREAVDVANGVGAKAETRIVAGDPATRLMQEADRTGVDLLCVGPSAGLISSPPRIGRATSRILREAPCSVLVARPAGDDFPRKVVCAIDGSEGSAELASFALSLAAAAGAEVYFLHVAAWFRGRSEARTIRRRLAGPDFERLGREAEAAGVSMRTKVLRGRPSRKLIKVSERLRSDLLILGHRGVRGVRRLGSVSEACARDAACSVLVSRSAETREPEK